MTHSVSLPSTSRPYKLCSLIFIISCSCYIWLPTSNACLPRSCRSSISLIACSILFRPHLNKYLCENPESNIYFVYIVIASIAFFYSYHIMQTFYIGLFNVLYRTENIQSTNCTCVNNNCFWLDHVIIMFVILKIFNAVETKEVIYERRCCHVTTLMHIKGLF